MLQVVIPCFPAEPVVELPVRVYPPVVYIAEDPEVLAVQAIVKVAQAKRATRRMLGVTL